MIKKVYIILIIFVLTLVLFIGVPIYLKANPESNLSRSEIAHLYSILYDLNTYNITGNALGSNLRIIWRTNAAGISKELVVYENNKLNKQNLNKNRLSYGENTFIVYFGENEVKRFIQIKENNWNFYCYDFTIKTEDTDLIIRGM